MNFLRRLALKEKILMTSRVSILLKSRASPDMLPFSLCNKKTCNSAHEQTALSSDTIDSVIRRREVDRAKDLLAPTRINAEPLTVLVGSTSVSFSAVRNSSRGCGIASVFIVFYSWLRSDSHCSNSVCN
jgi:hypothetical protein